jgi:S-adenosylmethionine:tRNA ribosyltransferase-isomerase
VTLHVGLDTFKPVAADRVADHVIHSEWASLSPETARRINEARLAGGRIVAVGTTAVRTLETGALRSAALWGHCKPSAPATPPGDEQSMPLEARRRL